MQLDLSSTMGATGLLHAIKNATDPQVWREIGISRLGERHEYLLHPR